MKVKKILGYLAAGATVAGVTILVVRPDIRENVLGKVADAYDWGMNKIKSHKENCECETCTEEPKKWEARNQNQKNFQQKPEYRNKH
jgi:hypothetical protein